MAGTSGGSRQAEAGTPRKPMQASNRRVPVCAADSLQKISFNTPNTVSRPMMKMIATSQNRIFIVLSSR
jgi:hypothetical protein